MLEIVHAVMAVMIVCKLPLKYPVARKILKNTVVFELSLILISILRCSMSIESHWLK